MWCKVRIQFILSHAISRFVSIFVENTVLSPLNNLDTFDKSHLSTYAGTNFWVFYSIPFVCMSVFMPVLHCWDYCGFIVNLKSQSMSLPFLFLFFTFFNIVLTIWGPLKFHMYFRVDFSFSAEKVGSLIGTKLNLYITLVNTDILTICLLIQEHGITFLLFMSF